MRLTAKDKAFLERLKALLEEKDLVIDFRKDGGKRFVLRGNYGDHIERAFHMSRQGVRWRFQRLFGQIYPSAYETILWIESNFGTRLRESAMAIAQERAAERRRAKEAGQIRLPKGRRPE